MSRKNQDGYEPDAAALVDVVEGLLARDEREGGRTMRELAALIVQHLLAELECNGRAITTHFRRELDQILLHRLDLVE